MRYAARIVAAQCRPAVLQLSGKEMDGKHEERFHTAAVKEPRQVRAGKMSSEATEVRSASVPQLVQLPFWFR